MNERMNERTNEWINIVFKNPKWEEADQLAIYKAHPRSWTRGNREQTQWVARLGAGTRNLQI